MPCLFGACGPSLPTIGPLVRYLSRAFGALELNEFQFGALGGHAHAPHTATGTDSQGRPFGVHGEGVIYRAAAAVDASALYEIAADGEFTLSPSARGTAVVFDPSRRRVIVASDWLSCFP